MPILSKLTLRLLLFLLHVPALVAAPLETVSLQLKWFHQYQFAGYYVAKQKGWYRDAGLIVEIRERDPSRNHNEQVALGEAEYGISDASILVARQQLGKLVVVAPVFQHTPMVLAVHQDANVLSPADLSGKRIMSQFNIDDAVIQAMLLEVGLDTDDYQKVPQSFNLDAFVQKKVDALVVYRTNQPFTLRQLGIPFSLLDPRDYGIDFYGDMLVTSEMEIRAHPDRVTRFREASLRGWKYALEHLQETVELIHSQYAPKVSIENLQYEAEQTLRMVRPNLWDLGHLEKMRFARAFNAFQELGLIPREAQIEGLFMDDYIVPPLWERPGFQLAIKVLSFSVALILFILGYSVILRRRIARSQKQLAAQDVQLADRNRILDAHVPFIDTDLQGRLTFASTAYCLMTGYTREELVGFTLREKVGHPNQDRSLFADLWSKALQGLSWQGEVLNRHRDGSDLYLSLQVEPQFDAEGKITGFHGIQKNITAQKKMEKLAITDVLTGLHNRLYLHSQIKQEIERARRYEFPLCVILVDIDFFKRVNDNFGHAAGDTVLVSFAGIATGQCRKSDIAGRWGGEEFLLLLPHTDISGALRVAEKIREDTADQPFPEIGQVTISGGVAQWHQDEPWERWIERADQALYSAKKSGRNRIHAAENPVK